jgi:pyrroline-5-carboxylate reductase
MSADPRYTTLMEADRRSVLQAAFTSLEALESVDAHYTRAVVAGCGPALAEALAEAFADASVSAKPTR